MNRVKRTVLLAACALLVAVPQALAHGGNPDYRSVIRSVTPSTPNVTFQVLNYDSYIQLLDQHGHEVMIYGYSGEPYARVLKDGTVQVNERSPATYLNDNRFAEVQVPAKANPRAAPQWKDGRHLRNLHLARPPHALDVPCDSRQGHRQESQTKIFDYKIPLQVDGQRADINGTLFWVGPADTSKTPFLIGGAVFVLLGGAGVLWVRRRRKGEGSDQGPPDSPVREAW